MASAVDAGVDKIWGWCEQAESRIDKLVAGEGAPGTRLAPSRSGQNDESIGCRIDFGPKFEKDGKTFRRYNLQINKGAKKK
ncbi:hypothetical protein E4U56_006959 [Claviceps arundinis]|uniref:Uncharacterized protein n=1 Tax=Claviceps arundinis TaxID=1623583 RepID=A0A9P7MK49_9HYPO|nr:hypothetical protein E4U56_006959 [Claviceps arundinis]